MNADGTNPHLVLANAVLPAWSPDGAKITFGSNAYGAPNGYDVFVMNADGTGVTRLETAVPAIDTDPNWSSALPTLSVADVSVAEDDSGSSLATFTITRNSGYGTSSVTWSTADGTAGAPGDYAPVGAMSVSFAAGEVSKEVSVTVHGDVAVEPDETFTVALSSPVGATVADSSATGTIVNDDVVPPAGSGRYNPLTPARILDTRDGTGGISGAGGPRGHRRRADHRPGRGAGHRASRRWP